MIMEDKINFSPTFIEKYANQINKHCGKEVNHKHLKQSILYRAKLIDLGQVEQIIENPLFSQDHFGNAESIIYKNVNLNNKKNDKVDTLYLHLNDYGISQDRILFIDSINTPKFQKMLKEINLSLYDALPIGFDTQFRSTQTKFDQQGVSIIQLCTKQWGFIIDFIKLSHQQEFKLFFSDFLTNQKIIKVGHTIQSDIKQLTITFELPKKCQGFIDVSKLFKQKHKGSKYTSLAYMCQVLLGKKLSKYEQRSNWNRRPLKKTQIHYAIMDAYSCILTYQALSNSQDLLNYPQKQVLKKNKQVCEIIRQNNLVYSLKYKNCLKKDKFLVDNMLKKLSKTMRNCGLDTQFIEVKNYQLITELAEKQKRIIITKDVKLFQKKQQTVPIYLLKADNNDNMFYQIVQFFKVNLKKYVPLSRCVKCNGPDIARIDKQQALRQLNFKHEDNTVQDYWRCMKCKKIYWQGNQFKRANQQFEGMINR